MNPGVPTLVLFAPPRVLNPPLAVPPGGEKFTLLKMLKNSDRNCRDFDSVNLKFLKRAKSKFSNLGPRSVLRPRVPYVKGGGTVKAAGLYQACGPCWKRVGRTKYKNMRNIEIARAVVSPDVVRILDTARLSFILDGQTTRISVRTKECKTMRKAMLYFRLESIVIADALFEVDRELTKEGERCARSNRARAHLARKRRVIHWLNKQMSAL